MLSLHRTDPTMDQSSEHGRSQFLLHWCAQIWYIFPTCEFCFELIYNDDFLSASNGSLQYQMFQTQLPKDWFATLSGDIYLYKRLLCSAVFAVPLKIGHSIQRKRQYKQRYCSYESGSPMNAPLLNLGLLCDTAQVLFPSQVSFSVFRMFIKKQDFRVDFSIVMARFASRFFRHRYVTRQHSILCRLLKNSFQIQKKELLHILHSLFYAFNTLGLKRIQDLTFLEQGGGGDFLSIKLKILK